MEIAELALPRDQFGANPQSVLATLLADYTFAASPGIASSGIIRLLAEFDVSESGARSALTRVVGRGLLARNRAGGETRYELSDHARRIHADRVSHVVDFGRAEPDWDGRWTLVAPLGPLERATRRRFQTALERDLYGHFGEVWISPHASARDARALAAAHEVPAAVSRGEIDFGEVSPTTAFELAPLASDYRQFIREYEGSRRLAELGRLNTSEALRVRTSVLRDWRLLVLRDPNLPTFLHPPGWPMPQARETFVALREHLADDALARVQHLVDDPSADLGWERLD